MSQNVYAHCPAYETPGFSVRLVQPEDAADLLICYADPQARRFFNSDNCNYGFACDTLPQMRACIAQWLQEYQNGCFVRFSIISRESGRAAGTIEMFHKPELDEGEHRYGILRIDLAAEWEKREWLCELLALSCREFFSAFGVTHILTKAIPEAKERVCALKAAGFSPLKERPVLSYGDYWIAGREKE